MDDDSLEIRLGDDEILVRRRYETLSIANDVLIALWFVAGSVLFFWESTSRWGTWMFLVGSIQFLARPAIRLARRVHIGRTGDGQGGHESGYDF